MFPEVYPRTHFLVIRHSKQFLRLSVSKTVHMYFLFFRMLRHQYVLVGSGNVMDGIRSNELCNAQSATKFIDELPKAETESLYVELSSQCTAVEFVCRNTLCVFSSHS